MSQLDLFAGVDDGLCQYGQPKPGTPRPCIRPATHAAVWQIPEPSPRAGTGRISCCLDHANYYAEAWCTWWWLKSSTDTAWLERIDPVRG